MDKLRFPFPEAPAPGTLLPVAEGVYWLRMPLPLALDHINLYLLEEADGWWIVDTGMKGERTRELWEQIFASALKGKPVKAVLSTHMHPDHVGQAGWLCDRWHVPFYMSFGEYLSARVFSTMTADDLGWTSETFYRAAGLPDSYFTQMKASFRGYRSVVEPLPGAHRRLVEGARLLINGREWQVMIGRGHSPEHVSLYCAGLGVLLAGDQVIANISPNVGVVPSEPEANPLNDWFVALARFAQLPADTLVLPAHKLPFVGVRERLAALRAHHDAHLQALETACENPQTAVALLPVLFRRALDDSQLSMALGECLAHLHYLVEEGRMSRRRDDTGVDLYQRILPVGERFESEVELGMGPMEI